MTRKRLRTIVPDRNKKVLVFIWTRRYLNKFSSVSYIQLRHHWARYLDESNLHLNPHFKVWEFFLYMTIIQHGHKMEEKKSAIISRHLTIQGRSGWPLNPCWHLKKYSCSMFAVTLERLTPGHPRPRTRTHIQISETCSYVQIQPERCRECLLLRTKE